MAFRPPPGPPPDPAAGSLPNPWGLPDPAADPGALPPLAPPPRRLPVEVWIRLLFSGRTALPGWLLLAGGLVAAAVAWPSSDLARTGLLASPVTSSGLVTRVEATSHTTGSRRHRQTLYANTFTYTPGAGPSVDATSWSAGMDHRENERVIVEFDPSRPDVARIQGDRYTPAGMEGVVIPGVFAVVGLGLAVAGLTRGTMASNLLSGGSIALGVLRQKEPVMKRRNGREVQTGWRLVFAYATEDHRIGQVEVETSSPEALEDDGQELVFYDPDDLNRAVMFDDLPGRPDLDQDGEFVARAPLLAWLHLAPPALAALALGVLLALLVGL